MWLWEEIATRYKGNVWVAGYNPLNEPADPTGVGLAQYYERLHKAIRAIDPDHILWLDGNTYAGDFSCFDSILPNSVYAIHDYSTMGFPSGQPYTGSSEQNAQLRHQYVRKTEFHRQHGAVIWNGEFGPVYANPDEADSKQINEQRYALLGEQMKIYSEEQISWTIWLYKDIGIQGMLYVSPDSAWMKLIKPFLEKKKRLNLDWWGKHPNEEMEAIMAPVRDIINRESPAAAQQYPPIWKIERHVDRAILHTLLSESLQDEFAALFAGKSLDELEELAMSFHFDKCAQRDGLNKIMSDHSS